MTCVSTLFAGIARGDRRRIGRAIWLRRQAPRQARRADIVVPQAPGRRVALVAYNKTGITRARRNGCPGIGDMWRQLDAAGVPFGVYSVEGAGC